jgi:anti-sigma B factor antagonist
LSTTGLEISPIHPLVGLSLAGELDLFSSSELSLALADLDGYDPIHIDLSELTFIDSSGIGAILAFARSRNGSGPVVLMNPSQPVRRAMEVVGLDQHPSIEIRLRGPSGVSRSRSRPVGMPHNHRTRRA